MKPNSTLRSFLILAAGSSLLAMSSASAQSWLGATDGDWLTTTNWTGDVAAGSDTSTTDTDIAVFGVNANNTVGINMTTAAGVYYLGAIDNTNATARIINNNSTTDAGVLTLNGATVNAVANTILRNSTTTLLTITNGTIPGTLGLALGNATTNVIQTTSSGGITINSIISGGGGITKQGSGGTLTLAGNNTYTGVTAISKTGGFLTVSHNNALGSTAAGSHTTIETDGKNTARISVSSGITTPENITITGMTEGGGAYNPVLVGAGTYGGTITLDGTGAIRIAAANWTGTITQATKTHGLVFQGGTSVSNPMTINGGALTILNGTTTLKGASGSGIGSTTLTQNGVLKLGITNAIRTDRDLSFDTNGTNRLNLAGLNQTVRGLVSSGGTNTRTVNNDTNSTTSTLTVGNGGGNYSFNGTIINATTGTGKVALTKTGAGTQTLSGANTYTGSTRIDEGSLALGVGGSINASASVTIKPGATLDTSAQASYTIPTGKPVNFSVDGTGSGSSGKISAAALNVSNATVTYDITGPLDDAAYVLATYTPGSLTGTFLSAPADPAGYTLNYAYEGNKIALVQTGVNTNPTISDIANQSVSSGGNTGALAFTVGDAETAPGALIASGSSSNTTLVPNANIVISGNGGIDGSRTVTVTPVSGLVGSATITITVTDDGALTAQDTFTLTVTDNYLSWAASQAPPVTGGPNGDDDNDGVKNLVEYALITGGERGVLSGNTITYTKRGAPYGSDLTYDIESSIDLGSWGVLAKPPVVENASTISYTFTPSTPEKNFARLKVVKAP